MTLPYFMRKIATPAFALVRNDNNPVHNDHRQGCILCRRVL